VGQLQASSKYATANSVYFARAVIAGITTHRNEKHMRISCTVEEMELEGDYGEVPSVCATCSRCGHTTESYGDSDASIRRCLVLMRQECPQGESNYYVNNYEPDSNYDSDGDYDG
jgi:hypothetical protein